MDTVSNIMLVWRLEYFLMQDKIYESCYKDCFIIKPYIIEKLKIIFVRWYDIGIL